MLRQTASFASLGLFSTETTFSVVYGVESTLMACTTPEGVMAQEEAYNPLTPTLRVVSAYSP